MRTQNSQGYGAFVVVVALKILILVARVGPDIARAMPPPRMVDDFTVSRVIQEGVGLTPDIADLVGVLNDDDHQ